MPKIESSECMAASHPSTNPAAFGQTDNLVARRVVELVEKPAKLLASRQVRLDPGVDRVERVAARSLARIRRSWRRIPGGTTLGGFTSLEPA